MKARPVNPIKSIRISVDRPSCLTPRIMPVVQMRIEAYCLMRATMSGLLDFMDVFINALEIPANSDVTIINIKNIKNHKQTGISVPDQKAP
jgi:hypothetical protein